MSGFETHPVPLDGRRLMSQDWRWATFLHWAVPPAQVVALMPDGVRPDVLDGLTYVGLIPFLMHRAGPGRGPAVPYLGDFAETNVRLYSVDDQGRRGVVFCSLDASRLLVALGARAAFATPYAWSRMRVSRSGDRLTYRSRRRWPGPRGAGARIEVQAGAPIPDPTPAQQFLTARFGLHTRWAGRTLWIPNEHPPWPLRRATLIGLEGSLLSDVGLPGLLPRPPDSVLFSEGVHTTFGFPRPVAARSS